MDLDIIGRTKIESLSAATPLITADFNISEVALFEISEETGVTTLTDPVYEQFLADVWVGIVLTLMVLSCVCFMCSCLIYHKFQEWKHRAAQSHGSGHCELGFPETELPSYTIASGLPTYEEALEQLKTVKECPHNNRLHVCTAPNVYTAERIDLRRQQQSSSNNQSSSALDSTTNNLSVLNLFGIYTSRSNPNCTGKVS